MIHSKSKNNFSQQRSHSRKALPTTNSHSHVPSNHTIASKNSKKADHPFQLPSHYQQAKKKIPKIICELQKNVRQLKKCYQENYVSTGKNIVQKRKGSLQRMRSHPKIGISDPNCSVTTQEIEDIRKSYVSIYGKNTSNLVELYNFYKKGIEKSTGILGSLSMSNKAYSMSMTNNNGDFHETLVRSKFKTPMLNDKYLQSSKEASLQKSKSKKQKSSHKKQSPKEQPSIGSKQRRSVCLINPFLENAGIDFNFNRQPSQSHIVKKPNKQLINVNSLLEDRSVSVRDQKEDRENPTGQQMNKNKDKAGKGSNRLSEQIQRFQRSKENRRGENLQINRNGEIIDGEGSSIFPERKRENGKKIKELEMEAISEVLKERDEEYPALISFGQMQSNERTAEIQKSKERKLIEKSPKQQSGKSIQKASKSPNVKSSGKKNVDRKSSSKKSSGKLNQAVIMEGQELEKYQIHKTNPFESSKYYVRPIPMKKAFEDSLQGLQITKKDSSFQKCLDLDFIPLQL